MGNNRNNRFKNAEECTEYLKQMNLNDLICVKYGGKFKAKSIFRCNKDKYEWESTLDVLTHSKSIGCPMCGRSTKISGIDEVNNWLSKHNRKIKCIYYDGKSASSNSKFRCMIDGFEWSGKVSNIKSGKGCPVCARVKKISDIEEVNSWLKENNKTFQCIEYCGNIRELSLFKCDICGKSWESNFNNIKNGNCCPHCSASKGEKYIENILDKNNIQYQTQYCFDDCRMQLPLPFDFAIFDNNNLIGLCEYQGIQHYEPIDFAGKGIEWANNLFKRNQLSDNTKRTYCKNNNIPLLEIPYWEFKNTETILLNFIKEVA